MDCHIRINSRIVSGNVADIIGTGSAQAVQRESSHGLLLLRSGKPVPFPEVLSFSGSKV